MAILDYAYREVTISTVGAGGVGNHDNFSNGSIAKAIIDFCTDAQCGLKQVKFNSTFDYAISASRLTVADEINNSGTLSINRPASGSVAFCTAGATRRFAVGEVINVLTSANTGILPLGNTLIVSSGVNSAGSVDPDAFGVAAPAGSSVTFNFTFTTAKTRKVFALKQGAVTHLFSVPSDESVLTLQPFKLDLTHKMLDTPYSPGASLVNSVIHPDESISRSSPNTPTVVPVESVTNYLTRLSKLHCFKCEDAFYFYVEKTDGSFTCLSFGRGNKRGSWVGGEFGDGQFFDCRYMHKPAPGISHSPMFAGFSAAINPLQNDNPYNVAGNAANGDNSGTVERFKTTKFRCYYPASRKGAKETVVSPPNARWAMSGDLGNSRDSSGAGLPSSYLAWFTAVGAGTPVASVDADGYVHAVVSGFTGIPGHSTTNDMAGQGAMRNQDPSVSAAPSGPRNSMPFTPESTEIPASITVGGSATDQKDYGKRVTIRHLLFAGYGQNVASPNGWNNRVPGHEVEFFVKDYRTDEEALVARYLDAMVLPGIRVGNVRGFAAKEIVNSDWMVFPVSRLTDVLASNYDAASYPACYGLGYFVKKGVSI